MLIHLTPTFINPHQNIQVKLKQLSILAGDDNFEYEIPVKDLTLKKPYPNKIYYVACIKRGNKAFNGLYAYIDVDNLKEFTVYEKWETTTPDINKYTHSHYIKFIITDNKFDSISQDFLLWQKYKTEIHKDWIPVNCTPNMELNTGILKNGARYTNSVEDDYHFNGFIKQRVEKYYVVTMPHQELFHQGNLYLPDRMPDIMDGFNLTRDYEK